MLQKPNPTHTPRAARASLTIASALVCLLCLSAPAPARQQPDNSNARPARTKRVTPLKTSDSQQGSRVTITSDGELNDYSAYRSGDRFIVVIPQAEGGGGAARGRGFEGAQVSRRGKDLVYTFKLEPGASARVNQRFNRLDVQFTASKSAATQAAGSATAAPTPRATRTPPEIAGLPSPTPAARPTPDARVVSEAAQQTATQQTAATPYQNEASPGFPVFTQTPAASPTIEPSVAPTAEQVAQAERPQAVAPGGAVVPPPGAPATTATLGSTLVNNWPWLVAVLLALGGVGLLLAGRLSARRGMAEPPPPDALTAYAPRETKAVPVASAATPLAATSTAVTTPPAAPAKAAPVAPVVEPRGKKRKKKGKGKVAAAPQAPVAKAEQPKTADAAETATAARPVETVETVEAVRPEASEARAEEVDATKSVAPAAAVVAPSEEIEVSAPAYDSERVGAEVKNLLAGGSYDESVVGATDAGTRQLIAAELSAALTGRNAERKDRARAAFIAHGYFDEAASDLQSAEAPGRRAAAAQSLALVGERAATAHLVAALEDPSADVRRAAVEALAELRDPAAVGPLEALRWREQSRQVPRQLIARAIELCEETQAEETAVAPAPAAISEAEAVTETREAEAVGALDSQDFASYGLVEDEVADRGTAETFEEPSTEPAAAIAGASAAEEALADLEESPAYVEESPADTVEETWAETSAEAFDEVAASEASVAGSRAADVGQGSAVADLVESGAAVETGAALETVGASESPVSLAGEETPAAETEPSAGAEAVYTFDESEAAAWAERRSAPSHETEEDLLAELDALEAAGAESRAAAEARPSYVAPEFALRDEESLTEERLESGVEAERAVFDEVSSGVAEGFAPSEETFDRPTAGYTAEESSETAARSDAVKSVELFEDAPAAAQSSADTTAVEETSFAIEQYRPEEAAARTPFAQSLLEEPELDSEEVGLAPAPEEAQSSRGLAAADDYAATGLDVPRHEKGLSASLDDAAEISIIPKAIQLRLESEDSHERAESVLALARLNTDEAFTQICAAFDDRAEEVRDAAARALYEVSEDRAESFTRALREAPAERRRNIGAALASSGLAEDAVSQLTGESRDRTYDAFSLLFLMAKAGETTPLIRAIESHPDNEVRLAVVKLLALSGQQEVLPSFRRLAVRGSLPTDVRAAVMEAIYQISSSGTAKTPAGRT
jgi:hypothetical protein